MNETKNNKVTSRFQMEQNAHCHVIISNGERNVSGT